MKELLPKISDAIKESFVGNYVFSDEELARVYDFTGCLLRNYDGTLIPIRLATCFFIRAIRFCIPPAVL